MALIITNAGIAASANAQNLGVQYKLTHMGIGTAGYVPSKTQTKLQKEVIRRPFSSTAVIAPGQLHFEALFDGQEEFEGKEIGYYLEDGTLFAVDSQNGNIITYKHKNSVITEACELTLAAEHIPHITVELMGTAYATETVAGIAKLATNALIDSETNDNTILTPLKALRLIKRRISSSFTQKRSDYSVSEAALNAFSDDLEQDERWTNAREWTAATVSQTEAEAGTATTRRAWTAQRVRQAINAWWNTSAMKTKLNGIATGATKNDTDDNLKNRDNHTGTQEIGTIKGLQEALDAIISEAGDTEALAAERGWWKDNQTGIIVQWGYNYRSHASNSSYQTTTVSFPIAFPTSCFSITESNQNKISGVSRTQFTFEGGMLTIGGGNEGAGGGGGGSVFYSHWSGGFWLAVGH